MANQSAKKNQQSNRTSITVINFTVYGLIIYFLAFHIIFLISQTISIWKIMVCLLVSGLSYFCVKQTVKCWELGLPPEAAQYYLDVLALNGIVMFFSPISDYAWHAYWLVVVFLVWIIGKYLWAYITPKYQQKQQEQNEDRKGKKEKKQKKQKIKYVKH